MIEDLAFTSQKKTIFYLSNSLMCVCEVNRTEKHGRPPNPGGSANKPTVSGLSVVKLLFSCGGCISKLWLSVLRTLNRLPGTVFNVAQSLFSLSDLLFPLHIISNACS